MFITRILAAFVLVIGATDVAYSAAGDQDRELPDAVASPSRGAVLPTLYASFAALSALDAYSTTHALRRGAREANPIVKPIAGSAAAFWVFKGATSAVSIGLAEKLWRDKHRVRAIAVMVVANGMLGAVAAHNARALGRP